MTLTIYGSARSRTMRVLWMAEELQLDYQHMSLAAADPALKQPAFLALNPAGAIPAIDDDGVVLSESLAINLYLAKRYGAGGLYPADSGGEAQALRWTLWAQGHLEPWVQRDAGLSAVRAAAAEPIASIVRGALAVLDRALAGRSWLAGVDFTVADLNVAAVLSPSRIQDLDLAPFANLRDWLDRCYARPARIAVYQRFAG